MTLDDIQPSTATKMTPDLVRLFKYAGCSPTRCHACGKRIKVGHLFKLLTHARPYGDPKDEMCCSRCGEDALVKRDKRESKRTIPRGYGSSDAPRYGGYERPSKGQAKGDAGREYMLNHLRTHGVELIALIEPFVERKE